MATRSQMPARLLVVDRDTRYAEWLRHHLGVLLPDATVNSLNLSDFQRWSEELSGRNCDVLMLGATFGTSPEDPQAQGLDLLRQLRDKPNFPAVIAVAEDGNELTAVRALQLGAVDYLPKRLLTPERLKTSVKLALRLIEKRVARRIAILAAEAETARSFSDTMAKDTIAKDTIARDQASAELKPFSRAGSDELQRATQPDADPVRGNSASADSGAEQVPAAAESTEARTDVPTLSPTPPSEAPEAPVAEAAASDAQFSIPEAKVSAPEAPVAPPPAEDLRKPTVTAQPSRAPLSAATAPGGEFMPADFIPGYTIHATIGESEKAAVYVATSVALGRNVALKVSKTLRDEAAGRQFLEREYTAIVAIRDPSVVQIHDYGVHAGYEYLVMEYLPRGDLKARMQQGLTEFEALRYLELTAAALQVVHQAGLLHRDLKPPNVMLRDDGDVALIDFGLARALDGSTPSTRVGVLRGSPYYMSPEQAMGEILDARSDFYSLGIMFYEMLTGRKPYMGGSAMDVLQQHVNAPLPQLPKALVQYEPLLLKLLAKPREQRYSSAVQLLDAIGQIRGRLRAELLGSTPEVETSAA
jgi:DNA-binding response OmpR family regulator